MKRIVVATLGAVLLATSVFAQQSVTISTADNFALTGKVYSKSGRQGPGLLLLHDCTSDQRSFETLADMLATVGYHVLTVDLRGFGLSKGSGPAAPSQSAAALGRVAADLEPVLQALNAVQNVNATRLGFIAVGCTVPMAVNLAARHAATVRALVVLSGGTDAAGEAYLSKSKVPVLAVASEEDTAGADGVKKIAAASSASGDSQLKMLKGAGRGTAMFQKADGLEADIALWLRSAIQVQSYSLRSN